MNDYLTVVFTCLMILSWTFARKWEYKIPQILKHKLDQKVIMLSSESVTVVKTLHPKLDTFEIELLMIKEQIAEIQKELGAPVWLNLKVINSDDDFDANWCLTYLERHSDCSVTIAD